MGGWTLVGHWRLPDKYIDKYSSREAEDMPNKFRLKMAPKIWYFMVNAGAVFFLPFLGIFWRDSLGYSTNQIGIMQALRPRVSAASGNLLTPLADKWHIHYAMLLITYSIGITSRGLMTIGWSFGIMLVLSLLMESTITPMGIIVDATVVAGSSKIGTYGRARLWASIGWGCFAPLAGYVLNEFGVKTCFKIFAGIYAAAFIPTALIPAYILGKQNKPSEAQIHSPNEDTSPPQVIIRTVDEEIAAEKGETVVVHAKSESTVTASQLKRRSSRHHQDTAGLAGDTYKAAGTNAETKLQATQGSTVVQINLVADSTTSVDKVTAKDSDRAVRSKVVDSAANRPKLVKASTGIPVDSTCLPTGILKELLALLRRVDVMMFMFKAFLMGVANGFIGYIFLLLTDEGASGLLLGLCLSANCIAEVPVFYFSGKLIEKLGVELSLNISIIAYLLRLGAYAMIPWFPSLWIVLPIELLQGLTFALAWSAGTVHCRNVAPPHLRSSVQSVFSGLYSGVGAGVGGLAGGLLYGSFNGQIMCIAGAGVMFIGWVVANGVNSIWNTVSSVAQHIRARVPSMSRLSPSH